MNHEILLGLGSIIVIGIAAQWLAWRIAIPSILLLLVFGFIAGPLTGFINPDKLLGDALFPIVSISVAIILFEGGLSLKFKDLKKSGNVVRNLISIGALVTWILSSLAVYFILDFDLPIALLLGAILIVTGPTVIIPLLRHVRVTGRVGSIVKWEGIVNDPIGAIIAVLVLEAILIGSFAQTIFTIVTSIIITILISAALGGFGALILIQLLKRHWIPGYLHSSITLMIVVGIFTASNLIQSESGLLSVTLLGILMANQKQANLKHIIEFKENLGILLISTLFIILAARLKLENLADLGVHSLLFLIILIVVVRPASIFFSTIKSDLTWKEKVFLSMMAPRGIVAAAVTSIFAVKLISEGGFEQARFMVPEIFSIIVGTVTFYGLLAVPLGKWLGLASPNPQGVIIAGSHSWAREIGSLLKSKGFDVLMVDTNRENINEARMSGINTIYGSIISDYLVDEIDLGKYGSLLALTPNDEVNSLASLHLTEILGRSKVFQLAPYKQDSARKESVAKPLRGRVLFGSDLHYEKLDELFSSGLKLKSNNITDTFTFEKFKEKYSSDAIPLFIISENKKLEVITPENEPKPEEGDSIISLVKEIE